MENKQEWAKRAQRKELSKQGLVEKLINLESKGYGNLGRETQKTQQSPMGMKDWNGPGIPKEMKRVEDAQNKMGQGSPKALKWAKEA